MGSCTWGWGKPFCGLLSRMLGGYETSKDAGFSVRAAKNRKKFSMVEPDLRVGCKPVPKVAGSRCEFTIRSSRSIKKAYDDVGLCCLDLLTINPQRSKEIAQSDVGGGLFIVKFTAEWGVRLT